MKIFWAILVLLVVLGGAYVAFAPSRPKDLVNAKPAPAIAPPMERGVQNTEAVFFTGDESVTPRGVAADPTPAPKVEELKPAPTPAEVAAPAPTEAPIAEKPVETPAEKTPTPAATPVHGVPASTDPLKPLTENQGVARPSPALPTPTKDAAATQTAGDVTIVQNDDGTMLVDTKYTVRGDGSKEKPYEITWEYLISAEETYQPRLGKKTLPGRLTMLHDKYVKITGYIAFPIMATEATEMLAMLNQWDGCCIGVPPTPYDAIEVKLAKPAEGEERLASYGVITGKMKVDPYLVKDWLVSLYMMEEGEMAQK